MAKVFGRATIKADGKLLDSMKGATLDVGGIKRSSKTTANKVAGFTEELTPSKLECSVPLTAGFSIADAQKFEDVTLNFETDVGRRYTINHAFLTDPPTLGDTDGEVKLMFEGEPAQEN